MHAPNLWLAPPSRFFWGPPYSGPARAFWSAAQPRYNQVAAIRRDAAGDGHQLDKRGLDTVGVGLIKKSAVFRSFLPPPDPRDDPVAKRQLDEVGVGLIKRPFDTIGAGLVKKGLDLSLIHI